MRTDPTRSVCPARYVRLTSRSMACRFALNTSSLSLLSPWKWSSRASLNNSRFSTGTMTAGAICRCWALSVSTTKQSSICVRRCNAGAAVGAVGLLRRLVGMIRGYFPGVSLRVRLDGGFAHPAVLDFLEAQPKLEYVVAMGNNAVLKRIAAPGIRRARQLSRRSGKTEHLYGEVHYAARKWGAPRRGVIKAEG